MAADLSAIDRAYHEGRQDGLYEASKEALAELHRQPALGAVQGTALSRDDLGPVTTWSERDLAGVVAGLLEGTVERPKPTVGRRSDGEHLFYAARVNALFGESGDGKTWVAFKVAAQELEKGQHVVWADFEDDEIGAVGRLLDLGVDPHQIPGQFHYLSPEEPYSSNAEIDIRQLVVMTWDLVRGGVGWVVHR